GPGGDQTDHDLVVCTNDLVGYRWEYDVPTGEAAVIEFTATLPEGATWEASNLALCQPLAGPLGYGAVGSISPDGRTFTCTLTFEPSLEVRTGAFPLTAR